VSSPPNPMRPPPPVGSILLLVVTGFVYLPMLLLAYDHPVPVDDPYHCTAAAGGCWADALGEVLLLFFGALVWLALGGMLVLGRKEMPPWASSIAFILYGLSAVAALGAYEAYVAADGGWSVLVLALLPPLIAGYALWVRLPALAARVPADLAARVALGAMTLVTVSALPLGYYDQTQLAAHVAAAVAADAQRQDARIAAEHAEIAKLRQQEDAKFQTLGPDSPLADYVFFVFSPRDDDPRRQQALEGVRHVKSRQADAVRLLEGPIYGVHDMSPIYQLVDLWQFDLEATPALCAAYDGALQKVADTVSHYFNENEELERQLPNIKFLVAGGCDLDAGLGAAAARVGKDMNSGDQRWESFRATLLALRKKS
jgi:hypothetical protein